MAVMEIQNTRRILAVSLDDQEATLSHVVQEVTGSKPESSGESLAGVTHDLPLKTKYYSATVPIWLDTIQSPLEWSKSFLSDEAGEVLAVLGGLLVVFSLPPPDGNADRTRELLSEVGRVARDGLGGWEWDGVRIAVGVGSCAADEMDEWDELCAEAGMEFVHVGSDGGGRERMLQEFGEKTGMARVKEALEANDWEQVDADDGAGADTAAQKDEQNLGDIDPESLEFGIGQTDMDSLRKAIWAGTGTGPTGVATEGEDADDEIDDEDVAKVEKMMRKLQAAREAGQTMGEAQRRRMAAKAVEEVMKDL